jgi:monofunctional glycosyltransferase
MSGLCSALRVLLLKIGKRRPGLYEACPLLPRAVLRATRWDGSASGPRKRSRRTSMAILRAQPRRALWRKLLRGSAILVLAWIVGTWVLVLVLRFLSPPTSAFMLERRIDAWRAGERDFSLKYQFIPLAKMSPDLPIAFVAGEDQKFPLHHGFDVQAIEDAMEDADDGGRLRGASTISQQTAKNLFLWSGRSFVRKGLEAYFTVLLELTWPKSRILEIYANTAEFGDGMYGVEAASKAFFGKSAQQVTEREAALLAATLPNPKKRHADRPSALVLKRADWIQRQVRQLGGPAYLSR